MSPSRRASALAILALVVFAVLLTSPLWRYTHLIFSERLFVDGINTAWHYDHIARALADGRLPTHLDGWDWPCAPDRGTAPNWLDGAAAAPIAWLLDWPRQYGAQMAGVLLLHGLGVAAVAAALGARGPWLFVAGAVGLSTAPLWHELQAGRLNGGWSGVALATVAVLTVLARAPEGRARRLAWVAVGALLGGFTLAVWPMYVAFLAPAGAVLVMAGLRQGRLAGAGLVLLSLGLGLALAAPTLLDLATFHDTFYGGGMKTGADAVWCIRDDTTASGASLSRLAPAADYLRLSSAAASVWLLLPLALFAPGRLRALGVLASGLVLVGLSLGPCPAWSIAPGTPNGLADASRWWALLWSELQSVHRMERFALTGIALVAAAGAAGLHGLARRGRVGLAAAVVLGAVVVGHGSWLLVQAAWSPSAYRGWQASAAASWQQQHPGAVVAVLPFDGSAQFIDALVAPDVQRLNPFEADLRTHSSQPAVAWLKHLGSGSLDHPPPSPDALRDAGIDAVLYAPGRCGTAAMDGARCQRGLPQVLQDVLGTPDDTLTDGTRVWSLAPAPGARAATEATCGTTLPGEERPEGTVERIEAWIPAGSGPAGGSGPQ